MLRSFRGMQGYWVGAVDGRMGEIKDFYFDDQSWTIRYAVADTARWLPGRLVLISPAAFLSVDWDMGVLQTNLTKAQVENSPTIAHDEPVSRQQEVDLAQYFSWPVYWEPASQDPGRAYLATSGSPREQEQAGRLAATVAVDGDPHLRSMHTVVGYRVEADDGEAGQLDDFMIDDQEWAVRYVVVDVGSWWAAEKVLVHPRWLEEIDWEERRARFRVGREKMRSAPRLDLSQPVSRNYEEQLAAHYGRPGYWQGP